MKKNNFKLIISLMLVFFLLLANIITTKVFSQYIYAIFWLILLVLLVILVGFQKDKQINKIDIIQQIFIYSILYMLATYLIGVFTGFFKTGYNLSLSSISKNIIPVFIIITLQELTRYVVITKANNKKIILILLVLVYVLYDFLFGIRTYGLTNLESIIKLIGLTTLPSIGKNILLNFLSQKGGYKPTIFYRLITELTIYFLPIFPNFGDYVKSILDFVVPMLLYLKFVKMYTKEKKQLIYKNKVRKTIASILIVIILAIIVVVNSGLTTVYSLSIGSWSMKPNLNVGDVILVKKVSPNKLNTLKIGDILVHEFNNKTFVHRIVSINNDKDEIEIQTKGDNNNSNDPYTVGKENAKGIVIFSIPYIGYPSVWLSYLFK